MTTTINADTVVGGAIITADASGELALQAAGVTKLTVASGGVTLATPLAVASGGTGATSLSGITTGTSTNLAGGSNGTIPYQSAAGTTQMLAVGTAGQVLQTNGAGAPSWVTPSAGAMTLLATVTASNSATVDFNNTYITSTYSSYVVMFSGWTPSVDRPEYLFRVSSNNLSSNLSCEYCVTRVDSAAVSIRANTTGAGIALVTPGTFSTSVDNGGASGSLYIYNPSSTSTGKTIEWFLGGYSTNSGSQEIWNGTATFRTAATAINSIRFQVSGGNIATGVFKLYGIQ